MTRAPWASDSGDQWKLCVHAYLSAREMLWEGWEINISQSKSSRHGCCWVALFFFCRVCVFAPHPECQGHREESPGAYRGSEFRQSGSLAVFM